MASNIEMSINNYIAKLGIETLTTNAIRAKEKINNVIDEIIGEANERRSELLNQIDEITKRKTESINKQKTESINRLRMIGQNDRIVKTRVLKALDTFADKCQRSNVLRERVKYKDTKIDVDITHLLNILDTIRNINNENKEQQYIKQIRYGLEGDQLLFSGYIRHLIQRTTMPTNEDVESLCFRYYSLNAQVSEHETQWSKNEESFNDLCHEIKKKLGDKIEDVIIDDFHHRKIDVPLRIIDHSLQHSFVRKSTKITIAINPSNVIIETMFNRFSNDSKYDNKTVKHLVHLLYGTHLAACDIQLTDPYSLCKEVHRLIKLGLAIYDSDSDSYDEQDSDDSEGTMSDEDIANFSSVSVSV
eukprot:147083_1